MPKEIPKFKTEDEEQEFWATHDSTEYIDWSQAEESISLLLPEAMLNQVRILAHNKVMCLISR